jgi:hypothetical protein
MLGGEDWAEDARCHRDKSPHRWISLDLDDIEYAKSICNDCKSKLPCLYQAVYEMDYFAGVRGGISEFDFKLKTWTEVTDERESNWPGDDRILQDLFREIL